MTRATSDNVAELLRETAARNPDGIAIAEPRDRDRRGRRRYRHVTFRMLDEDSTRIAHQLQARAPGRGCGWPCWFPPESISSRWSSRSSRPAPS